MTSIAVYCGSSGSHRPEYAEAAAVLGRSIAGCGYTLVYGGGNVGLMGVLADAALSARGRVVGVIPERLAARERAHLRLSELHVVSSMHERKALIVSVSDAFVAMPGGFGTLDELFEVLTWAQLGLHRKPVGLLNVAGYFDHLLAMFARAREDGFLGGPDSGPLIEIEPERLLERLASMWREAGGPRPASALSTSGAGSS